MRKPLVWLHGDADAIVIAAAFKKKTAQTPKSIADVCTQRYRDYDRLTRG